MWRPLKVAEADQWLNRRGKYVVYAACLSLSLPSIIAIKAVTGSERRSHYLEPGPAMPLLCRRRSAKHPSGTWTLGRAHSSGIGITLQVQADRKIWRESCRERVCQTVKFLTGGGLLQK